MFTFVLQPCAAGLLYLFAEQGTHALSVDLLASATSTLLGPLGDKPAGDRRTSQGITASEVASYHRTIEEMGEFVWVRAHSRTSETVKTAQFCMQSRGLSSQKGKHSIQYNASAIPITRLQPDILCKVP